jgi:hypothetical protein
MAMRAANSEQARNQDIEEVFNSIWHSADNGSDLDKQNAYNSAFEYVYNSYASFVPLAKFSSFYFRYGANKGKTDALFQTDNEVGMERLQHPERAKQVGISVYNETVNAISKKAYSFGLITRSYFHEVVHVRQAFTQPATRVAEIKKLYHF